VVFEDDLKLFFLNNQKLSKVHKCTPVKRQRVEMQNACTKINEWVNFFV